MSEKGSRAVSSVHQPGNMGSPVSKPNLKLEVNCNMASV